MPPKVSLYRTICSSTSSAVRRPNSGKASMNDPRPTTISARPAKEGQCTVQVDGKTLSDTSIAQTVTCRVMKVVIFGATGMIGKSVLLECLDDARIERV